MQVKLSDSSMTTLDVESVSQIFSKDQDFSIINISIVDPSEEFDYYKQIFTDEAVKTITVLNNKQQTLATLKGEEINQVSLNIQNNETRINASVKS